MRKLAIVLLISAGVLLSGIAFAESLREQLVAMKDVDSVWAMDKHFTVIFPNFKGGARTKGFVTEFVSIVQQYGSIEVEANIEDKLTEKIEKQWMKIELPKNESWFIHPLTHKKIPFLMYPEYYHKVVDNEFSIARYIYAVEKSGDGGHRKYIKKIVITHSLPQTMKYKSTIIDKMDLSVPPEGDFSLKPFSRGFLKGVQSGDIAQYMVLLSEKWGRGVYIVDSSEGYREVAPYDMFEYLETTPSERITFFFFCDNPQKPFVLKGKNGTYQVFYRTLEGIVYKPL